jgi:hypothetical protein
MKIHLFSFSVFSVILFNSSVNAQEIKLCRPKVQSTIQTVAQFIQYPTVPKCKKHGQGDYVVKKRHFFKEDDRFVDSQGNTYKHPERYKLFINPNKIEQIKK